MSLWARLGSGCGEWSMVITSIMQYRAIFPVSAFSGIDYAGCGDKFCVAAVRSAR